MIPALVWGYPAKYYLCFIHRHVYFYNSPALAYYTSQFIYTYGLFTSPFIVEIIIYIYVPCFCPYINCCNRTKYFISSLCSSGKLNTMFSNFYWHSLCPLQSNKPNENSITVCHYDNSNKNNHSDKPVPLSITPIYQEAEKVLFTMWGDRSLGSWYCNTSHYSARNHIYIDEISEEEVMEMFSGEGSRGNRSLETSHSSSINRGGFESCGHRYQETSHSTSSNSGVHGRRSSFNRHSSSCTHGVYVDRSRYRLQETSQSFSRN